MTNWRFLAAAAGVAAIVFGVAAWLNIDYLFFAGYVVLQYVVLASAWNILGGYTGYMNLGISAFFALGAYTTVALETAWKLPLPATIPAAAIVSGLVGLGMGYLTLRLKGIFLPSRRSRSPSSPRPSSPIGIMSAAPPAPICCIRNAVHGSAAISNICSC